jgi:hypothetical protein
MPSQAFGEKRSAFSKPHGQCAVFRSFFHPVFHAVFHAVFRSFFAVQKRLTSLGKARSEEKSNAGRSVTGLIEELGQ